MAAQRRCLCQICTCGRHRCPHKPTRIYDDREQPCLMTEYVEKYPQYGNIPPPQSLKPKQEYQARRGKMEGITTFKSDYLPYDVVKRPLQVQEEYKPKPGEIDLGTTYKRDYNPHKIQPVTLVRPLERKHIQRGKLDTIPTYQDDYRSWEVQRRGHNKLDHPYQPPTEKFGNSTTFQDDFIPRELNPRQSFKPPCVARLSDVPFNGITSHRRSYVAHPLEPKFIRSKEEYKPSSQPLEDLTTHRNDFKGLPGELSKSCKPEYTKVGSNAHFNGSTEFRDCFQPWSVSLPEVRKIKEYVPPTGNMDLNSTSHLDYVWHEICPVAPIRPVSFGRKSKVPFQGNTTMKEDFQAWDSSRQEIIKRHQEIPKPTGKFDGLTTFKSHYLPHEIIPAQSFKPLHVALPSSARFEDETMYRTEYTTKKQDICPANYSSPPGYVYINTDSQGHKFFHKVTPEMNTFSESNDNHIAKEVAVMS
ncbi:PREDICTED: stabilizer of axonemal microtubules 2 isoform X1 [Crocodylus porosus]|uniref:stabilizer of axonemal microtubules 2 isoform X1 n=2 Tax=Crocodylus porosus TaxID=8502 RepID=UPI00093ADCFD|nr:PREDICTED: stabilizer of axonemal microtubules 2 isoform X1 [Crocodylus porosus]